MDRSALDLVVLSFASFAWGPLSFCFSLSVSLFLSLALSLSLSVSLSHCFNETNLN
ncbi:hypothetical protein EXN66_Car005768 [Channa argus]|uniref:Uncharacterized protein n=1 Tax=Channa argus TaxID=215402 RepID=A0A6G1PJB4_CHAAH|nr:hypothetical protein EXN66_Car005768 [Channa argus]